MAEVTEVILGRDGEVRGAKVNGKVIYLSCQLKNCIPQRLREAIKRQ